MQNATHIYSGMNGLIIGYNANKRASLIKLPSGQKQYWRDETIIKNGELDMTNKILFKLTGAKNKTYHVIERYFNTVEEAYEYLSEMKTLNEIRDFSPNGKCASISNGWNISSNHDIREILKKRPPIKDLEDDYPFDLRKAMGRLSMPASRAITPEEETFLTNKPKKHIAGKVVKLQDLTKDTRKARVILRGLVRKKKIIKPSRWEWEAGSADLETVKAALSK